MVVGAVDRAGMSLSEAVNEADLVILCTPVAQMGELVRELSPGLTPGVLVTDVGSVKASVVERVSSVIHEAGGFFVGSHPMAGSERTGVRAAREDLFVGAMTVVTGGDGVDSEALGRIRALWEAVGSKVLTMTPSEHDSLVSRSSHLPHFVAAALARYVLSPEHPSAQACLCATGFRDTTRVASGSPEMWRDIGLGNREAILGALEEMEGALAEVRRLIEARDGDGLLEFLSVAKERRDAWCGGGAKTIPE